MFSAGRISIILCRTVRPPIPESNSPIELSRLFIEDRSPEPFGCPVLFHKLAHSQRLPAIQLSIPYRDKLLLSAQSGESIRASFGTFEFVTAENNVACHRVRVFAR